MKKYITDECYGRKDIFEVVDEYPNGYVVWAIGRHNFQHPGYVPLAKEIKGTYNVDTTSLKTIKVDERVALIILREAVRKGVDEKRFKKIIKQYSYDTREDRTRA